MIAGMSYINSIVAAAAAGGDLEWLGGAVTAIGGVLVAVIGGVALVWRRRQDRKDSVADTKAEKTPTQKDGWAEVREARAEATRYYKLYRVFEDLYYAVASALRALARKVHEAHPEEPLDKHVTDAIAMKPPDTHDKS